ncbi:MAG: hypothetical protein RLY20_3148 [Verrucomicrobiota bacterium]
MNLHHHHSNSVGRSLSGFSLIEVMVAILILGVALAVLAHGITTALASSKDSELQTTAMLFAQGKIEELRATFFTDGEDEGDCGTGLELYQWKQTIKATDIPGLHDVEVAIDHARTGQRICELRTMLFDAPVSADDEEKDSKSKKKEKGGAKK